MPRCTACEHPEREVIRFALASGDSERSIATRFGLSDSAVHRHRSHIRNTLNKLKRVKQREAEAEALTAQGESRKVYLELRQIADECRDAKMGRDFLQVADRIDRALRTWATLTGELKTEPAGVQALFVTLGVRGEDEIRNALQLARQDAPSLEQARDRALEVLRHVLQREPSWIGEVLSALGVQEPSGNGEVA